MGGTRSLGTPDRTDTNVIVWPKSLTIVANGRIPCVQLVQRDGGFGGDIVASIVFDDQIKFVAIVDYPGLYRARSSNSIGWRRWCWWCGACRRRRRIWGETPVSLDTVRVAHNKLTA